LVSLSESSTDNTQFSQAGDTVQIEVMKGCLLAIIVQNNMSIVLFKLAAGM